MSVSRAVGMLGRPVAYYPSVARFFGGDISVAVFVCQFMYWRKQVGDRQIWKTHREIEAETGISARIARRVATHLKKLGYLEVVKKGMPARNYYIWDWDAIDLDFARMCTTSGDGSSPLVATDRHHKSRPIVTTTSETTTEITAETTVRKDGAPEAPVQDGPSASPPLPEPAGHGSSDSEAMGLRRRLTDAFLAVSPDPEHFNFAREGRYITAMLDRADDEDDPERWLRELLHTAARLIKKGDGVWKGQPFLPSILMSQGMHPRLIEAMAKHERAAPTEQDMADSMRLFGPRGQQVSA